MSKELPYNPTFWIDSKEEPNAPTTICMKSVCTRPPEPTRKSEMKSVDSTPNLMSHGDPHTYSFAVPETDLETVDAFVQQINQELGESYLGDGLELTDQDGTPWRAWDGPVPYGSYGHVEDAVDAAGGEWCRRPERLADLLKELGGWQIYSRSWEA